MRPAGVKSNPFLLTGAAPNAVPPCWQRLCAAPLRKTALHYHVLEIQTRSLASVICLSWLGYRSPAWGSSGRQPAAAEPACPRMDCSTHHHGSSSRGICSHGCVIGWGGLAVIREADHRHTRCQPSPIRVWKSVVLDRNSRLNEHWRRFLASSPRTPRRPVKRRNHQRRHSATRD